MPDMHTRFETRVTLDVPPEQAWEALEDMTSWQQWTDVFDVRPDTPSPTWRSGHAFCVGPSVAGVRLWARVEIVECDTARRLVWAGTLYGIPGQHGFEFDPLPGGRCRMTHWEACGGVLGRVAVLSGAWGLLEGRFHRFNRDLQRHLASPP